MDSGGGGGEVAVYDESGGGLGGNAASNQVVVDALPYIDLGYDEPGVREAVRDICWPFS